MPWSFAIYFFVLGLGLMHSIPAQAEYRVYQYLIKNINPSTPDELSPKADKEAQIVTSTLDPISYRAYHGGGSTISVSLLKSWMCYGYTGKSTHYCPSVGEDK